LLLHQAFLSLIGIGSNQPLITMAQQHQHQLLGGISFQIDNITLFASFGIIQWNSDAERRVITSPEDDASYRIVGHASRAYTSQRTWGG
jgi:hypothetical protein